MIFWQLFIEFFKIGVFTFGGGYAMVPLLKETVLSNKWLSESQFYDFIGVCESTPGPIGVNLATYVGATQAGFLGSLVATFGVILPSFLIIILVATILAKFIKNRYVQGFLNGLKPVIIGLIISTGVILLAKCIGYTSLDSIQAEGFKPSYAGIASMGVLLLIYFGYKLIFKKKTNTILFIIISAGVGIPVCLLFAHFGLM